MTEDMVVDRSDLPVSCSTQRRETSQRYRLDSPLQCSTTPTSASVSVIIRFDAELRWFNSHLLSRLSPPVTFYAAPWWLVWTLSVPSVPTALHLSHCTLVAGVNPLSTFCPKALQLSQCTLVAGANPLCTFCTHGITSFTVHSGGWCKPSQHLRPMALHISHCIVCEPSQHLLYPWYCTWANVGTNIKLLTSDVALHAWLLQQQEDRSECGSHSGSHIKKLITTSYV